MDREAVGWDDRLAREQVDDSLAEVALLLPLLPSCGPELVRLLRLFHPGAETLQALGMDEGEAAHRFTEAGRERRRVPADEPDGGRQIGGQTLGECEPCATLLGFQPGGDIATKCRHSLVGVEIGADQVAQPRRIGLQVGYPVLQEPSEQNALLVPAEKVRVVEGDARDRRGLLKIAVERRIGGLVEIAVARDGDGQRRGLGTTARATGTLLVVGNRGRHVAAHRRLEVA